MLRAHRQAWCWQDEYFGLTIEDVRRLENETQRHLAEKMAAARAAEVGESASSTTTPTDNSVGAMIPSSRKSSKGDANVHFVDQTTGQVECVNSEVLEERSDYSRSVSVDSKSSSSTLVNGGKGMRHNSTGRIRVSGKCLHPHCVYLHCSCAYFMFPHCVYQLRMYPS